MDRKRTGRSQTTSPDPKPKRAIDATPFVCVRLLRTSPAVTHTKKKKRIYFDSFNAQSNLSLGRPKGARRPKQRQKIISILPVLFFFCYPFPLLVETTSMFNFDSFFF